MNEYYRRKKEGRKSWNPHACEQLETVKKVIKTEINGRRKSLNISEFSTTRLS